ncbi:MAG: tRNA (adenosine(37)-N6)-threonylcarbamoyltransferase complex ATPase subunit type 1 TsaE [Acidobacteriota bacterium]|nr:tRNA (adenosine(37)-N6)-threonylcarbamoyltransferase complex ATPase subunit type 1 TsaE [Acidobacteriota bacterium]
MEYITNSEEETFLLAKKIAKDFKGNEVVFLIGELGAGKTVFAKGIASGLGLEDVNQVCSPSFTLVNIYKARWPIYHMDFYRLQEDAEIDDLGWEDFINQGVIIVEWAEKMKADIQAIRVHFKIKNENTRKITISF